MEQEPRINTLSITVLLPEHVSGLLVVELLSVMDMLQSIGKKVKSQYGTDINIRIYSTNGTEVGPYYRLKEL